ncbi:MAG: cation diffusion facilitator family transporter [Chitinophagales bacterium]|nr:cation diffusion facilitator family transporter [Chitinophagales bacterium]
MSLRFHTNEKINIQWWVLIIGVVLMLVKFSAYFITHSNAILSDALESFVNIFAGAFGLYSLYLSAKPRDEDHPYGHGKIEFVSSILEGTLISIAGIIIIYKAVYALIHPQIIHQINYGIILILISGIVNYLMGVTAIKKGKKYHSLALEASGTHLKSDAYSTVGIIMGLGLFIITDQVWLDNATAIIMGLIIIISGVLVIRKSLAGIMDEADFKLNEEIIKYVDEHRIPKWIDIHNFRIIKYGGVIHIDCHLTMPWYLSLEDAHQGMKKIEKCLANSIDNPVESFIHVDPCIHTSCAICMIQNCPHRKHPFEKRVTWILENVIKNQKHQQKNPK